MLGHTTHYTILPADWVAYEGEMPCVWAIDIKSYLHTPSIFMVKDGYIILIGLECL